MGDPVTTAYILPLAKQAPAAHNGHQWRTVRRVTYSEDPMEFNFPFAHRFFGISAYVRNQAVKHGHPDLPLYQIERFLASADTQIELGNAEAFFQWLALQTQNGAANPDWNLRLDLVDPIFHGEPAEEWKVKQEEYFASVPCGPLFRKALQDLKPEYIGHASLLQELLFHAGDPDLATMIAASM